MRIPRDCSGKELEKRLSYFGYRATRQVGSHLRLTTQRNGAHHITVPLHGFLRIGTLSSILNEVASHLKISRNEVIEKLFDQ